MKNLFMILTSVASLAMVTALGVDQSIVNGVPFDLTNRYVSGQLDQRLVDIQSITTDPRSKTAAPKVCLEDHACNELGHEKNHRAMRRHVQCALRPSECVSSWTL